MLIPGNRVKMGCSVIKDLVQKQVCLTSIHLCNYGNGLNTGGKKRKVYRRKM